MSTEISRRGHGRRLPTDESGCPSLDYDAATPKQRFYACYHYFRLEPGEPLSVSEDVYAKRALRDRGEAGSLQSFDDQRSRSERERHPLTAEESSR